MLLVIVIVVVVMVVDSRALAGLYDYPQIIKKPMALGTIKDKLKSKQYNDVFQVAEDVRLVWTNCMTYNADGSDFFLLAKTLSKKFEDKFAKLLSDNGLREGAGGGTGSAGGAASSSSAAAGGANPPFDASSSSASAAAGGGAGAIPPTHLKNMVSLEAKRNFAKSLYKLTKEELGKILVELDQKCPSALVKNSNEDEVELNVDKITPEVFTELVSFANQCRKAKTKKGGQVGKKARNQ